MSRWPFSGDRRRPSPHGVAYCDVVAALCTLADMAYCLPPLHDQGRTDLDGPAITVRRDEFLIDALHRLDRQ